MREERSRHEGIAKLVAAKLRKAHSLLASVGFYLDERASGDELDYLNSLLRDGQREESAFADRLAEASEMITRLLDAVERG